MTLLRFSEVNTLIHRDPIIVQYTHLITHSGPIFTLVQQTHVHTADLFLLYCSSHVYSYEAFYSLGAGCERYAGS